MTEVRKADVVRALYDAGLDEDALRDDYSGRAMYGATCFGIVCDMSDALLFAAALGSFADDWDWIGQARFDDMGKQSIIYWPSATMLDEEAARPESAESAV